MALGFREISFSFLWLPLSRLLKAGDGLSPPSHVLNLLLYAWLSACHVCWLPAQQLGSFGKSRNPISSKISAGNIPLDASETLPDLEMPSWPEFSLDWLPTLGSLLVSQITLPDYVVLKALFLSSPLPHELKPFIHSSYFSFCLFLAYPVTESCGFFFPSSFPCLIFYFIPIPKFGLLLSYSS